MTRTLRTAIDPPGAWGPILAAFSARERRLLLALDFDGTLAPIVPRPEQVRVGARMRRLVALAARAPGVTMVVLSARPAASLRRFLPGPGLRRIGQYGLDGWVAPPVRVRARWRRSCRDLVNALRPLVAPVPGAYLEPKGLTVAVHDRAVAPAHRPALRRSLRRATSIARGLGFRPMGGQRVSEFVPGGYDKGRALREAVGRVRPDLSIYVGDSEGDEPAFAALRPPDVSIRVGPGATRAAYRVESIEGVRRLLASLVRLRVR